MKETNLLRIGILGCGPIAQAAHFEACRKARNVSLYAICDRAPDLLSAMETMHRPTAAYPAYAAMLADPLVEAVVIAVADQFHVSLAQQALAAGKHVFVEKPMGVSVEECERLREAVQASGLTLQIGHNKRFDPGIAFARRFVQEQLGQRMAFKAWYRDSFYRYTMTDNLQPLLLASPEALRPEGNPKADKRSYYMLTHGSHLVDLTRFLGGEIVRVQARWMERFGAHCWFITVDFADGSLGHIDLVVAVRGDWDEGFSICGEGGTVNGKTYLPWFHKSSDVECFSTITGQYQRPLGADAHTYKLQLEGFADTILKGAPQQGATVEDGLAVMRVMVAIARSVETGRAVGVEGVTGSL